MLSFEVKIILKSWGLNIEYGFGMYRKYCLSIRRDVLFLVLVILFYGMGVLRLEVLEVEGSNGFNGFY